MGDPQEACVRLLDFFPRDAVDDFAHKQLKRAIADYLSTKRPFLSDVAFEVDGVRRGSLLEAFAASDWKGRLMLRFFSPVSGENWDYNRPTRLVRVIQGGMGVVEGFEYNPRALSKWDVHQEIQREEVMVRGHFTRFFVPESIKMHAAREQAGEEQSYASGLLTPEEMWEEVRGGSAVPLQMRLCAYTHGTRYAYDIDLLRSKLLRDFRGGALTVSGKRAHSAQQCHAFDMVLASISLPENVRRAFIIVFEREGTTLHDVAHSMGMTEASARNTLLALASRKLIKVKGSPPQEVYEADIDEITRAAAGF